MFFTLLLLLPLRQAEARDGSRLTYTATDPRTGRQVQCGACPRGTYLSASCTETHPSACAPCPPGSFTALENYITKCLRCGSCGNNQRVKEPCAADRDCVCECEPGFFFKDSYDMCVPHGGCPPGQGVLAAGTADTDTVCHFCPDGTFSDVSSAERRCERHRNCSASGLRELLRGNSWHDSICLSCSDVSSTDAAEKLREILPSFFARQRTAPRRLRRILQKLCEDSRRPGDIVPRTHVSDPHAWLNRCMASANSQQIGQLVETLKGRGASRASETLQRKLQQISRSLSLSRGLCESQQDAA